MHTGCVGRKTFVILLIEIEQCSATDVLSQGYTCAVNFCKELYIIIIKGHVFAFVIRIRNTHTRRLIVDSFIEHEFCFLTLAYL
jgi:hypothetical protein